jgi:hypothetical protein
MQDERWEAQVTDSLRPLMPRAMPSARFVHDLEEDVRRAARQRMDELGIQPAIPFEEMVIELRKLVLLLRKTLIPVSPRTQYVQRMSRRLQQQAVVTHAQTKTRQQRLLMVGSVLGSVLSVGGLVAAYVLRKRNNGHSDHDP